MWQFPGAQPTVSENTGEVMSILGGRFIMTNFKGTMMGKPFEDMQVDGYDNMQNKFQTFWVDNSSMSFDLLSGTYDAKTKAWTSIGQWADPMGGLTPVRTVTRVVGPDEYICEMFMGSPTARSSKASRTTACARRWARRADRGSFAETPVLLRGRAEFQPLNYTKSIIYIEY